MCHLAALPNRSRSHRMRSFTEVLQKSKLAGSRCELVKRSAPYAMRHMRCAICDAPYAMRHPNEFTPLITGSVDSFALPSHEEEGVGVRLRCWRPRTTATDPLGQMFARQPAPISSYCIPAVVCHLDVPDDRKCEITWRKCTVVVDEQDGFADTRAQTPPRRRAEW